MTPNSAGRRSTDRIPESHRELVDRVVAATARMDFERETWERALAIQGMHAVGTDEGTAVSRNWLDRAIRVQDDHGEINYNDWVALTEGHRIGRVTAPAVGAPLGYVALDLYDETAEERYLTAARRQAEAVLGVDRTSDGGLILIKGTTELWIDSLFLYCPLLARLSQIDGDAEMAKMVVRQFEVHLDHLLVEERMLIRHIWSESPDWFPESSFWSRGNGWFSLAMVDCARWMGKEPFGEIAAIFGRHLTALAELQDGSGFWRNTLDDPRGRLETSGSCLFAYGIACGVELGLIDDRLLPRATRAIGGVSAAVSPGGEVGGVAVMPGGPGVSLGATPFGQGLFLIALAALARLDALE